MMINLCKLFHTVRRPVPDATRGRHHTRYAGRASERPPEAALDTAELEGRLLLSAAPIQTDALAEQQIAAPLEGDAQGPLMAFVGAEGFGAQSVGGRGGDVYHVTNLNDHGTGSLRQGIVSANSPRTIIFDVSGTIELESNLVIDRPFLTLAGQTAPGDGITLKNFRTVIARTHDVIVRYLRFRPGDVAQAYDSAGNLMEHDSLTIYNSHDIIIDHVSASWSVDEVLETTASTNVTVQWSFITEALNESFHTKGPHSRGSLHYDGSITVHHTLYAHHARRFPEVRQTADFVNNVFYNWEDVASKVGWAGAGEDPWGPTRLNFEGNYYIAGPSTTKPTTAFQGYGAGEIWLSGNLLDSNKNGQLDGVPVSQVNGNVVIVSSRFDFPKVSSDDAATAYLRVLADAGASLVRDSIDMRIVGEVQRQTGSIIDSQSDVGGWPELRSRPAPLDTDQDGMPDFWENAFGHLNPFDASDRNGDFNGDGYTNLEDYLHALTLRGVNRAPLTSPDSYQTGEDTPLVIHVVQGLLANDGDLDQDLVQVILASGPEHGTLQLNDDGSFTYTPHADFFGQDSFTYQAFDGALRSRVTTVTVTVTPAPDAPSAVPDAYRTGAGTRLNVDATRGVLANDTDTDQDELTAELVSGPAQGTLALSPDGAFSYTPADGFTGSDSFQYRAWDGTQHSAAVTVTITVEVVNTALQAADDQFTLLRGGPLVISSSELLANDLDEDGDVLSVVVVDQPNHGQLVAREDGTLLYTPDAGFLGIDRFTYRAFDGTAYSNLAQVAIHVRPVADRPRANDAQYDVEEDGTLTVPAGVLLRDDEDAERSTLQFELVAGPANGQLTLNADGSLAYWPEADFQGTDGFTYRLTDSRQVSDPAQVTIRVTPVNDLPAAADDWLETEQGTALVIAPDQLLNNDRDPDGDGLGVQIVGQPAHGRVEMQSDGTLLYIPEVQFAGVDSFHYQAFDGTANSDPAVVTIQVRAADRPPRANDAQYDVQEDGTLTVPAGVLLRGDEEREGDPLRVELVEAPAHGQLTLNADGSFAYRPEADFQGTDGFTYRLTDGRQVSDPAQVTIRVTPVNDLPAAADDWLETEQGTALVIAPDQLLNNDRDPDGDGLGVQIVGQPAHGRVEMQSDGTLLYIPEVQFAGIDSFSYQAFDGTDYSDPAVVTIAVHDAYNPPQAQNDVYIVDEDETLTVPAGGLTANDSHVEASHVTAQLVAGPAHGSLTLKPDGSFRYRPDADFFGTDFFSYRLADGTATSNTARVTIDVVAVNDAPLAADDRFEMPEGGSLLLGGGQLLGNDRDPDGDPLVARLVRQPGHGRLEVQGDGSFLYVPAAGFTGSDAFQYQAFDGRESSRTATVRIQVRPNPASPDVVTVDSQLDFHTLSWLTGPRSKVLSPSQTLLRVPLIVDVDSEDELAASESRGATDSASSRTDGVELRKSSPTGRGLGGASAGPVLPRLVSTGLGLLERWVGQNSRPQRLY